MDVANRAMTRQINWIFQYIIANFTKQVQFAKVNHVFLFSKIKQNKNKTLHLSQQQFMQFFSSSFKLSLNEKEKSSQRICEALLN